MAAKTKTKKFSPVRNEAYHQAMVELRRSSAAQRHTPEGRKGSRSANKAKAIRQEW